MLLVFPFSSEAHKKGQAQSLLHKAPSPNTDSIAKNGLPFFYPIPLTTFIPGKAARENERGRPYLGEGIVFAVVKKKERLILLTNALLAWF